MRRWRWGYRNSLQLLSSIVAGTAEDGLDCAGQPTSLGYNLIGDDSGCELVPVLGICLMSTRCLVPCLTTADQPSPMPFIQTVPQSMRSGSLHATIQMVILCS